MAHDRDYGRDARSPYHSDNDRWRESSRYRYSDDRDRDNRGQQDDERGFFDRAGDEVRSWFGDEEAERRRERDARMDERYYDERSRQGSYGTSTGYGAGSRGYYGSDRTSTSRFAGAGMAGAYGGGWGSGGYYGRRDRERDHDRDWSDRPRYGETGVSGSRYRSDYEQRDYGRSDYGQARYSEPSSYGQSNEGGWGGGARRPHDENYSRWRDQQMRSLDRDYDEYRSEQQSQFESDFGAWRNKRQSQRQSMGRVGEHMEVVGSDGEHVGTVDKIRGDRIILTKSDAEAGGRHHSIPCSWIDSVDDRVTINKSADEAQRAWRDEENRQAMFGDRDERDRDREGPHVLGRSFSGTYER